jgi:hypothetical protein
MRDCSSRWPSAMMHGLSIATYGNPRAVITPIAAAFGRPQIDEQHLVLLVMNDLAERVATWCQIRRRELTLEDRVLQVIAEPAHRLVYFAEA